MLRTISSAAARWLILCSRIVPAQGASAMSVASYHVPSFGFAMQSACAASWQRFNCQCDWKACATSKRPRGSFILASFNRIMKLLQKINHETVRKTAMMHDDSQ